MMKFVQIYSNLVEYLQIKERSHQKKQFLTYNNNIMKKAYRLLKVKTEQIQNQKPDDYSQYYPTLICSKRSNLNFQKNNITIKQIFNESNLNIAIGPFLQKKKKTINMTLSPRVDFASYDDTKKDIPSTRIIITKRLKQPNKQVKIMKNLFKRNKIFTIIRDDLLRSDQQLIEIFQLLTKIVNILEILIEEVYSYNKMETLFKKLNNIIKDTLSKSLIFQAYTLCGLCLFIYGSYSLSIFYFDKALKKLAEIEKQNITYQNRFKETQIYKTVAGIFLIQGDYKLAKQFAYKYLRKAWYSKNLQEQLSAYDILGKIYHECQIKNMSFYFHNRMCKGQRQETQFIKLSNFELQKVQRETTQFPVYENIHIFIEKDKLFHEMLEDRYRMRDRNYGDKQIENPKNIFFFHTHRSPNRNLNSYRQIERRMIEDKNSKQLHFIKPKQAPSIKKLILEFMKFVIKVREEIEEENQNGKFSFQQIQSIRQTT